MALSLRKSDVGAVQFAQTLEEAFPEVDSGIRPFGEKVLVQIRTAKRKTAGGVHMPDETRENEQYNTQIAVVRAVGPLAFHNRTTHEPWPEGLWAKVGDYVRVPKYGGDRWQRPVPNSDDQAIFLIIKDLELIGLVTGDPRDIAAYV